MSRYFEYLNERFPLPLVTILALGFGLYAVIPMGSPTLPVVVLFGLMFAGFMLRQRTTDEFKDSSHDTKHYPSRPMQRGLMTKQDIIALGVVAFVIEIGAVYFINPPISLYWYIPVLAFSGLMAVEFLMSDQLEKRFTLYFLLHECIFIFIGGWILVSTSSTLTYAGLAWLVSFVLVMMSVEVARKYEIRIGAKGETVQDTYLSVWGEHRARTILASLILGTGVLMAYSLSDLWPVVLSTVFASAIAYTPSMKPASVKIITALNFLLIGFGAAIL